MLVGEASGVINLYQLRDKNIREESPRSMTFYSNAFVRKGSMENITSPTDIKRSLLESRTSNFDIEGRFSLEEERKPSRDPKFAYGYFVNRSRYHKQTNPSFCLELIGSRLVEKDREVRDIKINKAQTMIYVLLSDGTTHH